MAMTHRSKPERLLPKQVQSRMKRDKAALETIAYKPIGFIHTPFKEIKGMPIQSVGAKNVEGTIEIRPEYVDGLKDMDGFSHLILIYHFHVSVGYALRTKPFMDDRLHGVFATRAPRRPNPIGLSVVRLVSVEGSTIHIKDVDIVDGTPLLDMKPYVPEIDSRKVKRIGWLSKKVKRVHRVKADERFR
jgi:tRNA (adenine37-N6)-methyltransferase